MKLKFLLFMMFLGVSLVSIGGYLLGIMKSKMNANVFDTRLGPVNITLKPGETKVLVFEWRITNSNPKMIAGSESSS